MKKWIITDADINTVNDLAEKLQISIPLCKTLVNRGITTYNSAYHFFRPHLSDLHNPYLLNDMDKAIDIVMENIDKRIVIYGDYDVDGVTSVAMLYEFMKEHLHVNNISYYVAKRQDGYGISKNFVQSIIGNIDLLITIDCGIKDYESIKIATDNGIKVIVIDHHEPDESQINSADAILDPKLSTSAQYPFRELSGCGVGFKFIHALLLRNKIDINILYSYLDLVALSTACDLVPLHGENRVLMYFGIAAIKNTKRIGLRLMMNMCNSKYKSLDVDSLVFYIGPRLNAPGRLEDARVSVDLLLSNNEKASKELCHQVEILNRSRISIDRDTVANALKIIENSNHFYTSIAFNPNWHPGVLGIVASKCVNRYHRPTIILTEKDGAIIGSARSIMGFNIYNALTECQDLLTQFGGHEFAAGLTLTKNNLEKFSKRFEEITSKTLTPENLMATEYIDAEIDIDLIDKHFMNIIRQMVPFGNNNRKPVFKSDVTVSNYSIIKGEHIRFLFNNHIEAIGFNLRHVQPILDSTKKVSIIYNLADPYDNNQIFQMYVRDLKAC